MKKNTLAICLLLLTAILIIGYLMLLTLMANKTSESVAPVKTEIMSSSPKSEVPAPVIKKAEAQARTQPKVNLPKKIVAEEGSLVAQVESENYFLGRWCNNNTREDRNEFFLLEFLLSADGETKALFTNGGPFSETLNANVLGAEADLYFESIEGSMSFNEAAINYDAKDCTERVASAKIIDQNTLEIANFNDVCGHISASAETLLLTRLNDGEACQPDGEKTP